MTLLRSHKGFTLVEVVIVILLLTLVIGVTGDAFNRIVSRSLTLNRNAESNLAGMVGLQLLRSDLQAAGYGLPWSFSGAVTYSEATGQPGSALNAPNSVPRAVASVDNVNSTHPEVVLDQTDVLAIRGQSVASNPASKSWTYVESKVSPTVNPAPVPNQVKSEALKAADNVVVTAGIVNMVAANQLVVNPVTGKWNATFGTYSTIGKPPEYSDAEKKSDAYIIYGVDSGLASLRMPFNRADYYVRRPSSTDAAWFRLPQRCNAATGVLVKGTVNQSDGSYTEYPILDCVLDMQVVFSVRNPPDSAVLTDTSDISSLSTQDLREQLKEIKLYILAQEGGKDKSYSYPNSTVGVGPGNGLTSGTGSTYDFAARGVPDWRNYRWRVYQIVARPNNLAGSAAQ